MLLSTSIYSQDLSPEWINITGGLSNESAYALTTDSAGNVYVTGGFHHIVDFDPGDDELIMTSNGDRDIYVQKFNSEGALLWGKTFGGEDDDYPTNIKTDQMGNVFITGYFEELVDFDVGDDIYELTSNGHDDAFILKLSSSGDFVWARAFGGTYTDRGQSISIGVSGAVYTAGIFQDEVDFDPGPEVYELLSGGSYDAYILKLDEAGNFIWVKTIEGEGYSHYYDIDLDNDENLYLSGFFNESSDFDPGVVDFEITSNGLLDYFIQKLDASGNLMWIHAFGAETNEKSFALDIDYNGDIIVTGHFLSTIDFDPDPEGELYLSATFLDGASFIQKLTATGDLVWAKAIKDATIFDVTSDLSGNIFTVGDFHDTVDFNPNDEESFLINSANGVFISKLTSDGNFYGANAFVSVFESYGKTAYSVSADKDNNVYFCGSFSEELTVPFVDSPVTLYSMGLKDAFVSNISNLDIGLNYSEFEVLFNTYPNPFNETLNIESTEIINSILIYDLSGKIVYKNDDLELYEYSFTPEIESGLYILKLNGKRLEMICNQN